MKKLTTLIFAIVLPMWVGFAQQIYKTDSLQIIKKADAEIEKKITANIDSALTNIANAKTASDQKKQAVKITKVKQPRAAKEIIIKYVPRDTCLSHSVAHLQLLVPDTTNEVEPQPVLPTKKIKWYQFKKLRDRRKQKKEHEITDTLSTN